MNKKIGELFFRQPSAPFSLQVFKDLEEEDKKSKEKVASVQRNISKKNSVQEKDIKINSIQMNKSNASMRLLGKNYVLKSDLCKVSKSNFYSPYHELNPWLN